MEYVFVDFIRDGEIAVARGCTEVEIVSTYESRVVSRHEIPEPAMAVWCFPSSDRIVIGGYNDILFFRFTDWTLLRRVEVYSDSKAHAAPVFAIIAGMPMAGNAIEVYNAVTGNRLVRVRERSGKLRGWISLALAADAKAVAATREKNVAFFARGKAVTE